MALPKYQHPPGYTPPETLYERMRDWFDGHIGALTILVIFAAAVLAIYLVILTAPRCPKCNEHINNKDNFCKHCGQQLRVVHTSE